MPGCGIQFSDGVGYDWVDGLKEYAAGMVSDASWDARAETFPEDTPRTREYYLLRFIFAQYFPHPSAWSTVPKVCPLATITLRTRTAVVGSITAPHMYGILHI